MADKLIRVDKNGTKYYADCTCQRCGGAGYSDKWYYTGKKCYECGGSGKSTPHIYKVYTPEYEAKLAERRQKRAAKRMAQLEEQAPDRRAEWLSLHQFDEEGNTHLFLGDTFIIKELLKNMGAKFDSFLGWHYSKEVEGYDTLKININDVATPTAWGYTWKYDKDIEGIKKEAYIKIHGIIESQYIGNEGEKITVNAVYLRTSSYDSNFGYGYWTETTRYIHQFKAGNDILIWNTDRCIEADYGEVLKITGKIKQHSEYKGTKQTVLTRCKIEKGDTQ